METFWLSGFQAAAPSPNYFLGSRTNGNLYSRGQTRDGLLGPNYFLGSRTNGNTPVLDPRKAWEFHLNFFLGIRTNGISSSALSRF